MHGGNTPNRYTPATTLATMAHSRKDSMLGAGSSCAAKNAAATAAIIAPLPPPSQPSVIHSAQYVISATPALAAENSAMP